MQCVMQHGISTCLGTEAILGELGGGISHRKAKSTDSKDQIEMVLCTDIPLILKGILIFSPVVGLGYKSAFSPVVGLVTRLGFFGRRVARGPFCITEQ